MCYINTILEIFLGNQLLGVKISERRSMVTKRVLLSVLTFSVLIGFSMMQSASAGIVGIWLMDENKGKEIKEATGAHKQNGAFVGGVEWESDGKIGSAIRLDGSTGHIEVPDPDNHLTPKNITLMAWIMLDDASGTHSILEQYDWAGSFGTHAFRTEGGQLQFWVIWGPAGENALGGQINAGEWMHVAGSYDGETIRTFINHMGNAETKLI